MFRRIFDRHKLEVSIIACGDTGQAIGAKMIVALESFGANVKSLAITSELEDDQQKDIFTRVVSIDDGKDGFAKKLDDGIAAAKKNLEKIDDALQKIIPDDKEGLLLMTTGAGATGIGSTLVLIEHLYTKYHKIPPIMTLLPENFENSRVQYNISVFLYRVAFKPDNRGNSVLLLDNKPNALEMDQPFSSVSNKRLQTIPTAFADLLYASFEDAISPEFDAKVNDLFEVMHTPGVSVFISEKLSSGDSEEVDSSRISDVIAESVMSTTSLTRDQVFDAKNAYIALFNIHEDDKTLSFQTEFEARKLFRSFRETHPFIKIVSPDEKHHGSAPKLRGIITGLTMPNRILQVMRIARNARKRIIIKEYDLQREVIPFNMEKIERLEEKFQDTIEQ